MSNDELEDHEKFLELGDDKELADYIKHGNGNNHVMLTPDNFEHLKEGGYLAFYDGEYTFTVEYVE